MNASDGPARLSAVGWILIGLLASTLAAEPVSESTESEPAVAAGEEGEETDRSRLLAALDDLQDGTWEQRLQHFENVPVWEGPFVWLSESTEPDEAPGRKRIAAILLDYMDHESDLWILDQVANHLAFTETVELTPIFRSLSDHFAPSVRYRAILYADWDVDDTTWTYLQSMWAESQPAWLRAELLESLLSLDVEFPREDCNELVWHETFELGLAALRCIIETEGPEAESTLTDLVVEAPDERLRLEAIRELRARVGDHPLGETSLTRLESFWGESVTPWIKPALLELLHVSGSELAAEAARRLIDDPSKELATVAIFLVGQQDGDHLPKMLIERASRGDPELRVDAIEALDRHRYAEGVGEFLMRSTETHHPAPVRMAAVEALAHLWRLGDDGFDPSSRIVQWIRSIALSDPDQKVRESAEWALTMLDIGFYVSSTYCGIRVVEAPGYAVDENAGTRSLRCHRGPGIEHDPQRSSRVPAGVVVNLDERFDDGKESWGKVTTDADEACWVPMERLRRTRRGERSSPFVFQPRFEFDVGTESTLTDEFQAWRLAGWVTTFDHGSRLVGVRLGVDATESEALVSMGSSHLAETYPALTQAIESVKAGAGR